MAQVVQRASLHTCMVICALCVCWLSLFTYLLFFSFLSLLFQPFQTPFSAVHKKFMSQSPRNFRSGTVVSNDHETPRTRTGVSLGTDHPVFEWLVEWAATTLTRFVIRGDGKTSYEKIGGRTRDKLPCRQKCLPAGFLF